jgi:hypothetical protein
MRTRYRLATVVALLAPGILAVAATPASAHAPQALQVSTAVDCTHAYSDKDKYGTGHINTVSGVVPLRRGPYVDCATVQDVIATDTLYYHCYVVNSNGYKWTNVRVVILGTDYVGWIWNGNLDDGGSQYPC